MQWVQAGFGSTLIAMGCGLAVLHAAAPLCDLRSELALAVFAFGAIAVGLRDLRRALANPIAAAG